MKIIEAKEVANLIQSNDTVAITGCGGSCSPEALLKSIKDSYQENKIPKDLTVVTGISPGNLTEEMVGMNLLSEKGLVKKAICAHLGMGKLFGKAVGENTFPAFGVPLGVLDHLLRAIASKEPGIITKTGLNTFADPRLEGCALNKKAQKEEPIVELVKIKKEEYLFYKSFPINVALIKATYADEKGNISFEHEAVISEQFSMAACAHNNGGIVIVQVEDIKPYGSLKAKDCLINSKLVDYIIVSKPDVSLGDYNLPIYKPELTGEVKTKVKIESGALNIRKVCARRSAMEIKINDVINLGVGMPDMIAKIASEEGFIDDIHLSIECGPMGGIPVGGVAFGASINPDSIISTADNFDLYDGGFLDIAILGLAQVDKYGNVNVSKFGTRVTGPGGFINITQSTKRIIFMGSFTAQGEKVDIIDGKVKIIEEGKSKKFVKQVSQITFSSKFALKNNLEVLFVTERAVFKLVESGLELIEIAPGIDLQEDILNQMEFKPLISKDLKLMDKRLFKPEIMHLKRDLKESK